MSYRDRDSGNRRPPETEGMVSLKVDNLTYKTTPEALRRVFERYGDIGDVYIPRDPYTQDSRGFAFVRYYDQRDADDAVDAMDGHMMDGRPLRVQVARHARPQQTGFRRSGGPGPGGPPRRRRSPSRSRSRSRGRRRRSRSDSKSRSRSADKKSSRSHRKRDDKSRSKSPSEKREDSKSNRKKDHSRSRSPAD